MDALLPALALLALVLLPPYARAEAQEPVAAVWKERQLHFSYISFMAIHPCYVLRNRIANVLIAVGARPDLRVTLNNCDTSFTSPTVVAGDRTGWPQNPSASGPSAYRRTEPLQIVDVRVQLSMPAAMTPDVVAELKADRKRRELIARVTGDPLPLFDDPIAFAAQRKVVTLSHQTTDIEPADCELLEQMVSRVFKSLGVRVVRRGYACDRISVSRIRPKLDVEALVPVTIEPTGSGEIPASSDDETELRESEVSEEKTADQRPE